ncbi:MAG: hypothetical protein HZB38_10480 [Planctomycetes bacterium]|nr:hypothetical protein [Planctomycetota bacterium]
MTYKSFIAPGRVLVIESTCKELTPEASVFQASGSVDGREIVKGRLTLRHLSLAATDAGMSEVDDAIRERMRGLLALLWAGRPAGAAAASQVG